MSGREASRYRQVLEGTELLSIAESTIGSLSPGDLQLFIAALQSKTDRLTGLVRDSEDLSEEHFRSFFGSFLTSRRHSTAIIAENSMEELNAAIKSLRVSRMEPAVCIARFRSLKGAESAVLVDTVHESLHFLNPDIYALCTRWVYNPENGRGALSGAIKGKVSPDFSSMQEMLHEVKELLDSSGYRSQNFYGLDIACSLTYAGGMMGAKDTSMNSGGMEALFPNSNVLAAMMLGIRRDVIAHT